MSTYHCHPKQPRMAQCLVTAFVNSLVHSCMRRGRLDDQINYNYAPSVGFPVSFRMTPPPTHSDFSMTLTPSVFPTCDNVYARSQS